MPPAKNTLLIALIHNNDAKRLTPVRKSIASLARALGDTLVIECREFGHQATVVPHPPWLALARDLAYLSMERRWMRYAERTPDPIWRDGRRIVSMLLNKYARNRDNSRTRWQRIGAMEMAVTDKHVRAWMAGLEGHHDYILVLEDDAVFVEDSVGRVKAFFDSRVSEHPARPTFYLDLAGGLDVSSLNIDTLSASLADGLRSYRKPVTNTACGYILSAELAHAFSAILAQRPWFRAVGVDWMMNSMFMELASNSALVKCWHFDPPALRHGSTTGDFAAWRDSDASGG
jgi:hypothetical protein